jgi:hypothetical protein
MRMRRCEYCAEQIEPGSDYVAVCSDPENAVHIECYPDFEQECQEDALLFQDCSITVH